MIRATQYLAIFLLATLSLNGFALASSDDARFTDAELDQVLAPIALYPDTVLSHILIAATYPLEVVQAERWASANADMDGEEALKAVEQKDWDPSVKALVPFPHILERMSNDLNWTQNLGEAFLQSEERVMASVQKLRARAQNEGHLKTGEHQTVLQEDNNIVIESVRREVVYVPYYDPVVVYGNWWWPHHPPHYWAHYPAQHRGSVFVWMPSLYINSGFYFHSSIHWGYRHVVVINNHQHHRVYNRQRIVHHRDARHWVHNPQHRRGVNYRNTVVRERYGNNDRTLNRGRTSVTSNTNTSRPPRTPERTEGSWNKHRSTATSNRRNTQNLQVEREARPQSRTNISGDARVHTRRPTQPPATTNTPKPRQTTTAAHANVRNAERNNNHEATNVRTPPPKPRSSPPKRYEPQPKIEQQPKYEQNNQNKRTTRTYSTGRTQTKSTTVKRGSSQRKDRTSNRHSR